jgi:hypothetical protein
MCLTAINNQIKTIEVTAHDKKCFTILFKEVGNDYVFRKAGSNQIKLEEYDETDFASGNIKIEFDSEFVNEDTNKTPAHYIIFKDIKTEDVLKVILNSELTKNLTPIEIGWFFQVLKYSLRCGLKTDNKEDWMLDISKKINCKNKGETIICKQHKE